MSNPPVSLLELDPSLKGIVGSYCWGVTNGSLNLSMQFGKPTLKVVYETVRRGRTVRRVSISGPWTLWVYLANWRIVRSGVCLASTSSSYRKKCTAINALQGQRLVGARVNTETATTYFTFDLDTVLEVRRGNRRSTDELWLLYGEDGYHRSLRGNGKFQRVKLK